MLVRIDAAFEAVLGIALLLCAATGALDGSDFPRPVGTVVLVIAGVALLVLAVLIWSGRVGLRALAVCNAASAVAGIVWLTAVSGFSSAGAAVVGVTVAVLAGLAAAQAATLRA
jgi:hypothetical protein